MTFYRMKISPPEIFLAKLMIMISFKYVREKNESIGDGRRTCLFALKRDKLSLIWIDYSLSSFLKNNSKNNFSSCSRP